uniref:EGF-like domain-containing protein n=1 Tax=Esox lucius TaxID=8010 RepID=A0A3P8ZNT5_ESOLU
MGLFLTGLGLLLCCSVSSSHRLTPSGKNVVWFIIHQCVFWVCPPAVCDGERTCQLDEVCVYPGVCRCRPGYYGAHCKTRCPPEFWAPDCRELCKCHPHGRCDPVTGKCTCLPNRWGPLCENACQCGLHGHCHASDGNCTCDEGWWTPTCAKQCQCYPGTSTCDPLTGRCHCSMGYWGPRCNRRCSCFVSPCQQKTGVCECQNGWWGPMCDRRCNCNLSHSQCDPASGDCLCHPGYKGKFCNDPCGPGEHGSGCRLSCGHCKGGQSCSAVDGVCLACEPGWNGTRCDQPCPHGYHGDHCQEACPRCRNSEPCDPRTGVCSHCEPGWTGPRCDEPCSNRTFGDGCRFLCNPCFHGHCDHMTGSCVCGPGFQGESCNSTCPDHLYGFNCTSICDCGEGVSCHPATGDCPFSGHRALIAGLLFPLLLALLCLLCCCCCCGGPTDGKDRCVCVCVCVCLLVTVIPTTSRSPVSHHDPELTFNHSFIEPPSSGWVTDGSSFDSDEETGEALYCVPPREGNNSVCVVSGEDISLPFGIPRTSSIAKSKRPSVSFAEGSSNEAGDPEADRFTVTPSRAVSGLPSGAALGRRRTLSNAAFTRKGSQTTDSSTDAQLAELNNGVDKVTTVYVTVGKSPTSEGPVQAILRRLGSLQRHKDQEVGTKLKGKSLGAEGITKPPRRKLGVRASVWEQRSPEVGSQADEGVAMRKPSRRKQHTPHSSPADMGNTDAGTDTHPPPEGATATATPRRPLSSILMSVPEVDGSEVRGEDGKPSMQTENGYLLVGPPGVLTDSVSLSEVITNKGVVTSEGDEPNLYENVQIMHS